MKREEKRHEPKHRAQRLGENGGRNQNRYGAETAVHKETLGVICVLSAAWSGGYHHF